MSKSSRGSDGIVSVHGELPMNLNPLVFGQNPQSTMLCDMYRLQSQELRHEAHGHCSMIVRQGLSRKLEVSA